MASNKIGVWSRLKIAVRVFRLIGRGGGIIECQPANCFDLEEWHSLSAATSWIGTRYSFDDTGAVKRERLEPQR